MKVVFRADDVGYTDVHNLGTWKAIEQGLVSAVDLMLDTPGFPRACEKLKEYPWLSIGWHTHFWGKPVLPPEEVKSLVNEQGRFKWRKDMSKMFEVDKSDAYKEMEAELLNCQKLLGRLPDVAMPLPGVMGEALKEVCDKYGIALNYFLTIGEEEIPVDPKYKDAKIITYVGRKTKNPLLNVKDPSTYDSLKAAIETPVKDDVTVVIPFHAGYIDDYITSESSCTITRAMDVSALCSDTLRQWVKDNHLEIINMHDALYGTNIYQKHLKDINSDLYIEK